ncbi:MAG: C45 family autoproteolytic acyltransferase/hydrolase [Promethearchaeota archaeon]
MVEFIQLKGSAKERGGQQGQQLREKIHQALDFVFNSKIFKEVKPRFVPMSLVKALLGFLGKSKIKKAIKQNAPNQLEKILSIGKSANLGSLLPFGIHFIEVMAGTTSQYKNPPKQKSVEPACTMLFALKNATKDGSLLFGRNYDFPKVLQEYQLVRLEEPDDGYANINFTQLPLAGSHIALNEKGLAIGVNYGRSWKKIPLDFRLDGVPSTIILQEAIEKCKNTAEAVEFISKFPYRSNGAHYGIIDKSGECVIVETTSTRHAIRKPNEQGILVHTNLYKSPELIDANVPDDVYWKMEGLNIPYTKSPRERYERAFELMDKNKGGISIETMKEILSDHKGKKIGNDFTICQHGETGITLGSVLIKVKTGQFWVTDRQPCMSEFQEFKINLS